MTAPLPPSEVDGLLAELRTSPASEGCKVLVELDPPRVAWASLGASALFGTADRFSLTRMIFGRFGDTRPVTTRLARLEPGGAASLEAIQVRTRLRQTPVVFRCRAVPDRVPRTVLFEAAHATPTAQSRVLPDDDTSLDSVKPPSPPMVAERRSVVSEPAMVPEPAATGVPQTGPRRFVWRTDGQGLITQIGPEMQTGLGRSALQVGDNLEHRLRALSGAAVEAADALAAGRSWHPLLVDWPVEEHNSTVPVLLGGTPSAHSSGFRGFGLIPVNRVLNETGANQADPNAPPRGTSDRETSDQSDHPSDAPHVLEFVTEAVQTDKVTPEPDESALLAPTSLQLITDDAAHPSGEADIDLVHVSDLHAPSVVNAPVAEVVSPLRTGPVAEARSPEGADRERERPQTSHSTEAAPPNVVHLASFKPGGLAAIGGRTARREAPAHIIEASSALSVPEAPRWAEMPDQKADSEAADQRLSSHERFNFDEIARALAALPTAENTVPLSPLSGPEPLSRSSSADNRSLQARVDGVNPANFAAVLDALPTGVLVFQGEQVRYANRALLDLTGFENTDELDRAGGLASLVASQPAAHGLGDGPHTTLLRTKGGARLAVGAWVRTTTWAESPATLWSVRVRSDLDAEKPLETGWEQRSDRATPSELAEALDLAASGVGFLDRNGRVLALTGSAEQLFGYPAQDLVGENCRKLFAESQQVQWNAFLEEFATSSERGRTSAFQKTVARKRNGEEVPVGVSLRRVGPDRICIVWQRSVHGHATASELDLLRQDAERASALKSEFLAKISHEIRTPLNAMLGFTEMIIEERFGPIGNDRYREYLKDIHSSGTHVVSLVNDLLDLSRIESGAQDVALRPVNVNAVIGECVSTLQAQAFRDRIILRTSLAARMPLALADERAFRQIVLNLLSNAVKFNEPGGQVIVSTAVSDADRVVIRVRDTGLGMSDNEIELAMKPFRQLATPKASSGTGLGLPLTKAMIEACHGSFRIESKPGEGTLVEVTFPRGAEAPVSLPAE